MGSGTSPLKSIGYWRATSRFEVAFPVAWPHPTELPTSRLTPERRERLARYLDRGSKLHTWHGFSECRFVGCTTRGAVMGSSDLTDGTWVWPEGLAHYVRLHGTSLPDEFVAHAEQGGLSVDPPLVDVPPPPEVDGRFWIEWCAHHTGTPAPDADAAGLEELRSLSSKVSTNVFRVTFEADLERWRVTFGRHADAAIDYIPRWSVERVESYLMLRRVVPTDDGLCAYEAQKIADSVCGARSLMSRVLEVLKPGGDERPVFRAEPPSRDREFDGAEESFSHYLWVRSGTGSTWVPALDEVGLRYRLECFVRHRGSFLDAHHRHHRALMSRGSAAQK